MKEAKSAILSVDNLQVSFYNRKGYQVAVEGVSFDLNKGETLAIVGESGSGKSVTLLSIMQLLPSKTSRIDQGSVTYKAEDEVVLSELSEQKIIKYRGAKVAMIFQEPMSALNPSHRCGLQVAEMLQIHSDLDSAVIKSKVLEVFERVDLPDPQRIYEAYPHELSGGQLQRVMIAMAIICEPDILIADEPTTALDVTIQSKIMSLLHELKTDLGISTIFITHDLGLVRVIADRVIVMQHGRIVEKGSVAEVFDSPKAAYTRGLIACRPPLEHRYTRLPTVDDFLGHDISVADFVKPLIESEHHYAVRQQWVAQQDVILKADHITKHYVSKSGLWRKPTQVVKAVDGVSFELRRGETLGLVGESGCGKSTLAKVLLRLTEPTSGSVYFEGQDIFSLTKSQMRKVRADYQIIFQDPYGSLNPRMKIGAAITEPMAIHDIGSSKSDRKDRAIAILERVGLLAEHYDRYPHQFSGGQRQRICIARAVGLEPKFILCDESVSALDVSVQAQVLNLLSDLREDLGLSYIFISHDLSVVKHISDRIMVLKAGRIVEQGDVQQVIDHPTEEYTKALIRAIPR